MIMTATDILTITGKALMAADTAVTMSVTIRGVSRRGPLRLPSLCRGSGGSFLMGLIQSVLQFRALMVGKRARRGLPTMFVFLIPIVMLVLLKFMRTRYEARDSLDQADLRRQWDAILFWKKVSLWLKYGFTNDYPPMLGNPPQKVPPRAQLFVSPPRRITLWCLLRGLLRLN